MVRLEGFERLGIPGSVLLELLAGEEVISSRYIFQSTLPESCPTCRKRGRIDVDFVVDRNSIEDVEISTQVTCVGSSGERTPVSLEDCGNPTLSVRMPIEVWRGEIV